MRGLSERHEIFVKRVHAFRIPLSPRGQRFMGLVYFSIPVVAGYFIMQYALDQAEKNMKGLELKKSGTTIEQNIALQTVLDRHNTAGKAS